ncbi:MAG: hypothetical protein ACOYOK_02425 [Pseudobdellovibrionaceae bacterium]
MKAQKWHDLALVVMFVGFGVWSLFIVAQGAKQITRCQSSSPNQVLCDSYYAQNLNQGAHRIRLNKEDSQDFVNVVQYFGNQDILVSQYGENQSYKLSTPKLSVLFLCFIKAVAQNNDPTCSIFYNHEIKEPNVQILDNANFVNIRIADPNMVQQLRGMFAKFQSTAFIAKEKVEVRINNVVKLYSRMSLACDTNRCEIRGVPSASDVRPPQIQDDRPFNP